MIDVIKEIPADRRDVVWKAIATTPLTSGQYVSRRGKVCPLSAGMFAVSKQPICLMTGIYAFDEIRKHLKLSEESINKFVRAWDHGGFFGRRAFVRYAGRMAAA
jgi:hypothetical protein